MRIKLLSVGITLFWVCMMSSLIVQHILPEHRRSKSLLIEPEILAAQWVDIRETMWIRKGEQTLGAMVLTVAQKQQGDEKAGGYEVIHNAAMSLPVFGLSQELAFKMTMDLTSEFMVSRFIASVRSFDHTVTFSGFTLQDRLFFRATLDGKDPKYSAVRLRAPISLLSAVQPLVARQLDLEIGKTYPVDVMDPVFNMASGQAEVKVAAKEKIPINREEVEAYRLDTTFQGITKSAWVNKDGEMLRQELFQGIYLDHGDAREIAEKHPTLRQAIGMPIFRAHEFLENAGPERDIVDLRNLGVALPGQSGTDLGAWLKK